MASGNHFRELRHKDQARRSLVSIASTEQLLSSLQNRVIERFGRLSGLTVVTVPIDRGADDSAAIPSHPDCAEHAQTGYCRRSQQSHLARLRRKPDSHWHRCRFGKLCAYVPVVWLGRCVAACNLVCPDSMDRSCFERDVELLDVLVENFRVQEAGLLSRLFPADDRPGTAGATLPRDCGEGRDRRADHPRVLEAIEYIHRRLADANMTVTSIARHLDMNPSYLAHLFAEQTGMRMSRYIATRRIELAERCLATTNWQIKRVAYESGHVNADWFSHVFHAHTGLTPRQYRRRMRVR